MPIIPLYGHAALRERFAAQLQRGALPASLLFEGAPGIGKQRLALWLGQRLLCEQPDAPCGGCQHCQYASALAHPDLTWVFPRPRVKDSADIALDEVQSEVAEAMGERAKASGLYARPSGSEGIYVYIARWLVQRATLSPALARRKVIIIGEAERMVPQAGNAEAANAFLKLLEEPPADTTIILTSSEPGALLPTIRSRVVAVRVPPVSATDLRSFLANPAVSESLGAGDVDARVAAARGAPGALIGASGDAKSRERAEELLAAARASADRRYRVAFSQSTKGARGGFSDTLDALTVALHERAHRVARADDGAGARAVSRAILAVEEAKRAAQGNASPQLVAWSLLDALSEVP
ncbi:MAG: hypothetical protein K2X99_10885 [Gemmatimonadaceae bacterium]|nr:hypothetical protein [Gemmatimonadaceae bacterium]